MRLSTFRKSGRLKKKLGLTALQTWVPDFHSVLCCGLPERARRRQPRRLADRDSRTQSGPGATELRVDLLGALPPVAFDVADPLRRRDRRAMPDAG